MAREFAVDSALHTARLEVTETRREIVGANVESFYELFDQLDQLNLGEAPPASVFNPRRK